jgi:hypothetical protein
LIVDGNDETDIVFDYEQQIGELGNDFWKNHTYIDDVTQRVMYGEDVDRFREDIGYENTDMSEDEIETLAEERADEEESRRNDDLIGYLEEMGYSDIPSFVSKDYESAWNDLSMDYDVINYEDKMYVFSNNYGFGGGLLVGSLVGAYLGYKVGKYKKKVISSGFKTEKRIGKDVKNKLQGKKTYGGGGKIYGESINDWFEMSKLEVKELLKEGYVDIDTDKRQDWVRIAESDSIVYYGYPFEFDGDDFDEDNLNYYAIIKASGKGGAWEGYEDFLPLEYEYKSNKLTYKHPKLDSIMSQSKFDNGGGVDELNYGERGKKGYIEDSIKSNKRIIDLMQKYLDTDLEENSEKALSNRNKVREDMNKLKAEVLHLQDEISTYQGGGEIKASDLSNWDKKLDAGEDVVVYDKNGVKYIYQGSSYEKDSVAVMKGFDESTYRMMPLSEIKSIEIGSIYQGGGEIKLKIKNVDSFDKHYDEVGFTKKELSLAKQDSNKSWFTTTKDKSIAEQLISDGFVDKFNEGGAIDGLSDLIYG